MGVGLSSTSTTAECRVLFLQQVCSTVYINTNNSHILTSLDTVHFNEIIINKMSVFMFLIIIFHLTHICISMTQVCENTTSQKNSCCGSTCFTFSSSIHFPYPNSLLYLLKVTIYNIKPVNISVFCHFSLLSSTTGSKHSHHFGINCKV